MARPARDRAARRVDVEADVLLGIVALEVQELRDDQVGDVVVDLRAEKDDAVVEQARVDVEAALASAGLLDDDRDEGLDVRQHRGYSSVVSTAAAALACASVPLGLDVHRRRSPCSHVRTAPCGA